jgi:uncharacterized protein YkwD
MLIISSTILIQSAFAQMSTNILPRLPKTPTIPNFFQIEKHAWSSQNFLEEINKERTKKKLGKLKENTELNRLAKLRLDDMVNNNYFAHESPTKNGIDDLLLTSTYDYEWRGENLAYGEFVNEADVTKSWMESKWHKYNILYSDFKEVGTAHTVTNFKGGKYLVVVQVFGKEIKKDIVIKNINQNSKNIISKK